MSKVAFEDLYHLDVGTPITHDTIRDFILVVAEKNKDEHGGEHVVLQVIGVNNDKEIYDVDALMEHMKIDGATVVDWLTLREKILFAQSISFTTREPEETPKEPGRRPQKEKCIYHIDEWLDFNAISDVMGSRGFPNADYVHFVLDSFRRPAWVKLAHRRFMNKFQLYVDYCDKTYKVTGASRLGDIHLAKDLNRENGAGYDLRVPFDLILLTNWRDAP